MDIKEIFARNTSFITVLILALIILLPIGYSVITYGFTANEQNDKPFLEMPDPKYKKCVRETEYMRYHHWELLRGIREEVVRYGKREDIDLNKCRECHTSRERFCNKCHDATSLKPDCFHCHYYP
ncbi:hypothetical protein KKA00_10325 [bacterium]|nr:hypothetical protein [bacterium]MBU1652606.1 hypothetical protein [bacterium]MBU1882566.1 hypothetical protein [bacterium]